MVESAKGFVGSCSSVSEWSVVSFWSMLGKWKLETNGGCGISEKWWVIRRREVPLQGCKLGLSVLVVTLMSSIPVNTEWEISQGCIQIHKDKYKENFWRIIILHRSGKISAWICLWFFLHMEARKCAGSKTWILFISQQYIPKHWMWVVDLRSGSSYGKSYCCTDLSMGRDVWQTEDLLWPEPFSAVSMLLLEQSSSCSFAQHCAYGDWMLVGERWVHHREGGDLPNTEYMNTQHL